MEYRLTFTQEEFSVISHCLMFGPYGQVAPVINSINGQIRASTAAAAEPAHAPEQNHQKDGQVIVLKDVIMLDEAQVATNT